MIRITTILSLCLLFLASCTNREYKEGMTITKIDSTTIYTADGSELSIKPKGFEDASTIVLVRHAEKADDGTDNPGLTDEGIARAERVAELVRPMNIAEVFMTAKKRTIFTAKPLAMAGQYPVSTYNTDQYDRVVEKIFGKRAGKNVIIYGHSNTTPELINLITGDTNLSNIPEDEYDNMYIVQSKGKGEASAVWKFKF